MKTTFLFCLLIGISTTGTVQGQGLVTFRNTPVSAVINSYTGLPMAGNIAVAGLFYSADLGAVPDLSVPNDGWQLAAVTPIVGLFGGGIYSGGSVSIPGVQGGADVLLQVRAWPAVYSSPAEIWNDPSPAFCSLLCPCVGGSNVMRVSLARPGSPDPVPNISAIVQGFSVCIVPEPSTFVLVVLAGLGGVVFGLGRHRV